MKMFFVFLFLFAAVLSFSGSKMNMSKLILAAPKNEEASLSFYHFDHLSFVLSLISETGTFVMKNGRLNVIEIEKAEIFKINASKSIFQGIQFDGEFLISDIPQWRLFIHENYYTPVFGWSINAVSTCGSTHMLGGYGNLAGGEIKKTFKNIPKHKDLRITANYHFIDAWSGETGFMRLNTGKEKKMEYLWTERHDFSKGSSGVSICGAKYPENKFSVNIDLSVSHEEEEITVGFGSTLDQDAYENSFGVSNLQIFIK